MIDILLLLVGLFVFSVLHPCCHCTFNRASVKVTKFLSRFAWMVVAFVPLFTVSPVTFAPPIFSCTRSKYIKFVCLTVSQLDCRDVYSWITIQTCYFFIVMQWKLKYYFTR